MSVDTVRELIDANTRARQQITKLITDDVAARVAGFSSWYDHKAISALCKEIALAVEAAQRQTAALTDAYLSRVASDVVERPVSPVGPVDIAGLRSGVTHEGVYGRLADQVRYDVSRGVGLAQAQDRAVSRGTIAAQMDTDLAARAQTAKFSVVRQLSYRRVIHPELAKKDGTCGLCIVASEQVYHPAKPLMPIHTGCNCTAVIVGSKNDPGKTINLEDVKAVYEMVGSTGAAELRKVRVKVAEHGELGPLLVRRGDKFRGPSAVRALSA